MLLSKATYICSLGLEDGPFFGTDFEIQTTLDLGWVDQKKGVSKLEIVIWHVEIRGLQSRIWNPSLCSTKEVHAYPNLLSRTELIDIELTWHGLSGEVMLGWISRDVKREFLMLQVNTCRGGKIRYNPPYKFQQLFCASARLWLNRLRQLCVAILVLSHRVHH